MRVRADGYDARGNALVEAARHRPYRHGQHDCALWVAEVVEAVRGQPLLLNWKPVCEQLRGRYRTERGSLRVMKRLGYERLREAASDALGAEIPPAQAQRWDVVLWVDGRGIEHLGVCLGEQAVFLGPEGLTFRPTLETATAWAV